MDYSSTTVLAVLAHVLCYPAKKTNKTLMLLSGRLSVYLDDMDMVRAARHCASHLAPWPLAPRTSHSHTGPVSRRVRPVPCATHLVRASCCVN
jgi:hypothetical protein